MIRLARVLSVLLCIWLVGALVLFGLRHDDEPAHADAVVVLQGSKSRLPLGYRLMEQGYAPLMVISRGSGQKLEERLCNRERRFEVVCFSATSTRGEARIVSRIARERGLRSLDVVTSQFHVYRTRKIFRRCFDGELRMVGSPNQWWKMPRYILTESVKLAYQSAFARDC